MLFGERREKGRSKRGRKNENQKSGGRFLVGALDLLFNENITGLLSPLTKKHIPLFPVVFPFLFTLSLLASYVPFGWSKASQHTTKSLHLYKQMVSTIPQVTENPQKTNDARFKKPREKKGLDEMKLLQTHVSHSWGSSTSYFEC